MSKVAGSHASRRSIAMASRPSVRRSIAHPPSNRSHQSLTESFPEAVGESECAETNTPAQPMLGLIIDDGQDYVDHQSDDEEDEEEGREGQTIDEYIALLQRQRLDELGGDGDDVASNLLSQVLGDGSLADDDEDNEDERGAKSKKEGGSFGSLLGSVFGRKSVVSAADRDDDDDDDDDVVCGTTESNVSTPQHI